MPKISLVICLYKERDLLECLLHHADGCYDDLIVVHDGPEDGPSSSTSLTDVYVPSHRWPEMAVDYSIPEQATKAAHFWEEKTGRPIPGSIHELVAAHGGRFFAGPRCWQQEPHWPFAWSQAKHDWILRLDADEFPSDQLKVWLRAFRKSIEPEEPISGYTCIWPPWDGRNVITLRVPEWRPFLMNRKKLTYFGLAEQGPLPDQKWSATGLVLNHQPTRKSIGPGNLLMRKQAYIWRKIIAQCLQNTPLDLPRWRWESREWPPYWEEMRQKPLLTGLKRGLLSIPLEFRYCLRNKFQFLPEAALGTALHKALLPLCFWWTNAFRK